MQFSMGVVMDGEGDSIVLTLGSFQFCVSTWNHEMPRLRQCVWCRCWMVGSTKSDHDLF